MKNRITPELHVYFDMDGVLVKFSERDAVTKPFLIKGSHYFRYQPPDAKAIALMRCLDSFPKIRTGVLTRLCNPLDPDLADEHETDKKLWCLEHRPSDGFGGQDGQNAPFMCLRNVNDKTGLLKSLPPDTDLKRRILIDDDPAQLEAWTLMGGTACQYRQYGRRTERWGRSILSWDMSVHDMTDRILRLLN